MLLVENQLVLDILICSFNESIFELEKILLKKKNNVNYIISHQYTDKKYKKIPEVLNRKDIFISQIEGKGLSINRNNALKNSKGDICLIADDDGKFNEKSFEKILNFYKRNEDADVTIFQACIDFKNKVARRKNSNFKRYYCNRLVFSREVSNIIGASSIEITFRREKILNKKIKFDEMFGIGSEFLFGEEKIFLTDCLKKRLKIYFNPEFIVSHPIISTPNKIKDKIKLIETHGAINFRILKNFAFFYNIFYTLKNSSNIKGEFLSFLKYVNLGSLKYRKIKLK